MDNRTGNNPNPSQQSPCGYKNIGMFTTIYKNPSNIFGLKLKIRHKILLFLGDMEGKEGSAEFGLATLLAIMAVAAVLFFAPLGMGPLQPPSLFTILFIPVILVAVWIILDHAASK